jgi:PAS domain S-box-containing protein
MTPGIENASILIGDDSAILNNLLKEVFEEHGFEVSQAFDGAECKAAFLKNRPDAVLIDVEMPRINGMDVLRFIKEKMPRTITVVMAGTGNEKTAVTAMKLGADDYLGKPFATDEMVSLVTKLLEQRRAAEENVKLKKEVQQGEKYLAHLTTIINEAIITTDPKGRIEFTNSAVSKLWGYEPEELKDRDVHFLIRGEARTLLYRDLIRDTIRVGKVEGEFLFRKKDKGTFPGYLSTTVIKEKDRVRGVVLVVADLTRLYEIERRLKQSEKLAALGKVVEGMAHEVRNSLTSLGGFAARLQKLTSQNPTCERYTGIILDDVKRLERMVQDIEEFVRFSKFYTFHYEDTDVLPLVERARDRVMQKLSPDAFRMITFSVQADRDLPHIVADPVALEEVFYNLILNAYEAMPKGGRLKVRVKNLRSAISVSFTDTGIGIPWDDVKDVFNPFFTSKTTGAGMGLSKAYMLVDEHRGAVDVTSEHGKGATFEVFLPVDRLMVGLFPWESESRRGAFR